MHADLTDTLQRAREHRAKRVRALRRQIRALKHQRETGRASRNIDARIRVLDEALAHVEWQYQKTLGLAALQAKQDGARAHRDAVQRRNAAKAALRDGTGDEIAVLDAEERVRRTRQDLTVATELYDVQLDACLEAWRSWQPELVGRRTRRRTCCGGQRL